MATLHTRRKTGQRACFISSPTESLPDGTVISLCAVLPMSPFEFCSFHNLNLVSVTGAAKPHVRLRYLMMSWETLVSGWVLRRQGQQRVNALTTVARPRECGLTQLYGPLNLCT